MIYTKAFAAFHLHIHKQVFKNPYEVVTVLLIQTMGAMVPSIPVCLNTAVERAAQEQRLDTLLELHNITSTFGHSLETAMLPHLGLCIDSSSMTPRLERGCSNVQCFLFDVFFAPGENNLLKVNELVCALYDPYKSYQLQYGELEEAHLLIQISAVPLVRRCTQTHDHSCDTFLFSASVFCTDAALFLLSLGTR